MVIYSQGKKLKYLNFWRYDKMNYIEIKKLADSKGYRLNKTYLGNKFLNYCLEYEEEGKIVIDYITKNLKDMENYLITQ